MSITPNRAASRLARAGAACLVTALAACGSGGGGGGAPVAGNPPPPPAPAFSSLQPAGSGSSIEARTSQVVSTGDPSTVLDDFSLATATTVRTVRWQGIYCTASDNSPAPTPTATGFVVTFHPDAGGQPDTATVLQTTTFTLAEVNQTLERTQGGLICTGGNNTTWALYDYRATLPTPFAAAAGTRYWITVQAVTPSYAVYWGWRNGTVANSVSLQCFQGTCTSTTFDRAYALGS